MTEDIGQELAVEPLEPLIGFRVTGAWVGIGTFLVLDLTDAASALTASLWVYLADWAFLAEDHEVMSSDHLPTDRKARLPVDIPIGRQFTGAVRLSGNELHLEFDDGVRLEIWENREAYGVGAELLHIFRDEKPMTTLTFVSPPLH